MSRENASTGAPKRYTGIHLCPPRGERSDCERSDAIRERGPHRDSELLGDAPSPRKLGEGV